MSRDEGIEAACACRFIAKTPSPGYGNQKDTKTDQDMETIPAKTVIKTAPMPKKERMNKKKKKGNIISNKPKTPQGILKPDDVYCS